jgi:hypothetical protein
VVVAIEYMGGGRLSCDAVHRTAAGIAEVAPSFGALTFIASHFNFWSSHVTQHAARQLPHSSTPHPKSSSRWFAKF